MSINDFLTKQNVDLLWEVVIDDDIFKNKPKEVIKEINNIFSHNLKRFNEIEKIKQTNLINMNKKFISFIMSSANSVIQTQQKEKDNQLITSTDLHSERISLFEKELHQKQSEFSDAMSLKIPPVPKFSDNNLDKPMGEMELAIKKALEQRNYDIEQVSKTLNKSNADSWLRSQETSLKSEKLVPLNKLNQDTITSKNTLNNSNNSNLNPIKYIKIDNENIGNNFIKKDIIDLNQKKHLTWEDEKNDIIESNIFNKLKKITQNNEENEVNEVKEEKNNEIIITNRMNILEDKLDAIHNKIDLILQYITKAI